MQRKNLERNRVRKEIEKKVVEESVSQKEDITDRFEKEKNRIYDQLMEEFRSNRGITNKELIEIVEQAVLEGCGQVYLSVSEKQRMKRELFHAFRGFDVLSELIEDEEITEIMVNGKDAIFVEKNGVLYKSEKVFASEERLRNVIQQIVSECNRIVNETVPIVDARLQDGSRVNVVLPPVALNGSVMTIRKFPKNYFTMEKLIEMNAITAEAAMFLEQLVKARYNIFISGGTGSGKTTFLNVLSNYIPKDERIITIEDSAELQLHEIPNLVRLETRNANVEGEHAIMMSDLIKTALRMRPSRIIVGEVRDAAAMDMVTSMLTGHDGSLSTGHGNSAREMLIRLETMILTGYDMPIIAIRQQIAAAIDIVVHLSRLRDYSRRVLEISEIVGMKEGEICLNPLFVFKEEENQQKEKTDIYGELVKVGEISQKQKLLQYGGKREG